MKINLTILALLITGSLLAVNSVPKADLANKAEQVEVLGQQLLDDLNVQTMEDFLSLTPRQIKKATGKRLKLKQVIGLKLVQKKIKKKIKKDPAFAAAVVSGDKSQIVALVLALVIGVMGIHRFYLGYTVIGIVQLLTLGGCGIWTLIDIVMILTGDLGPADGSSYDATL